MITLLDHRTPLALTQLSPRTPQVKTALELRILPSTATVLQGKTPLVQLIIPALRTAPRALTQPQQVRIAPKLPTRHLKTILLDQQTSQPQTRLPLTRHHQTRHFLRTQLALLTTLLARPTKPIKPTPQPTRPLKSTRPLKPTRLLAPTRHPRTAQVLRQKTRLLTTPQQTRLATTPSTSQTK